VIDMDNPAVREQVRKALARHEKDEQTMRAYGALLAVAARQADDVAEAIRLADEALAKGEQ